MDWVYGLSIWIWVYGLRLWIESEESGVKNLKKNTLQGVKNLKDTQKLNQNFKNIENMIDLDLLRKRLHDWLKKEGRGYTM